MIADCGLRIADWKTVSIGDLVDEVATWVPERSSAEGFFDYIDLSAVDQSRKVVTAAKQFRRAEAPSRARQIVSAGDVLISTVRPNLNGVARVPEHLDGATASTGFCVLRSREPLDAAYLFHWVKSPAFVSDMVKMATGASYPAVSDRIIFESRIPLPPLAEQRRIAEVLDRAEALRAKRRAALAQLDSLTQSLFLDLFGDPVVNPQRFPISGMGDLCDVRDGTHDSPKYVSNGGYPLVTSKNLSSGVVDLAEVNHISEEDFIQINRRSKVDLGDIVMPMIGTIGSPVLIDFEPNFAIKNVALIKFLERSPSAVFIRHLLSCHYFDHVVEQKNRGGTQKFVSLGDLRTFPIPLPPLPLQQIFARRVAAVERLKASHRAALAHLDALFASLQHRAFRGEL